MTPSAQGRAAALELGWERVSWNCGERARACATRWRALPVGQRRAASVLGYGEESWDAELAADITMRQRAVAQSAAPQSDAAARREADAVSSPTMLGAIRTAHATYANHSLAHPSAEPAAGRDADTPSRQRDAGLARDPSPPEEALSQGEGENGAQEAVGAPRCAARAAEASASKCVDGAVGEVAVAAAGRSVASDGTRAQRARADRVVVLHKPTRDAKLGITLKGGGGSPTEVVSLQPQSVAAASGGLAVGDALLSVNGTSVTSHESATAMLRAAKGEVRLRVVPSRGTTATASDRPPPPPAAAAKQGAATPSRSAQPLESGRPGDPATSGEPLRLVTVRLSKDDAAAVAGGLRLVGHAGRPPYVAQLSGSAAAVAASVGVAVGQALVSVNGRTVSSAAEGSAMLAAAVAGVTLVLEDEEGEEVRAGGRSGAPGGVVADGVAAGGSAAGDVAAKAPKEKPRRPSGNGAATEEAAKATKGKPAPPQSTGAAGGPKGSKGKPTPPPPSHTSGAAEGRPRQPESTGTALAAAAAVEPRVQATPPKGAAAGDGKGGAKGGSKGGGSKGGSKDKPTLQPPQGTSSGAATDAAGTQEPDKKQSKPPSKSKGVAGTSTLSTPVSAPAARPGVAAPADKANAAAANGGANGGANGNNGGANGGAAAKGKPASAGKAAGKAAGKTRAAAATSAAPAKPDREAAPTASAASPAAAVAAAAATRATPLATKTRAAAKPSGATAVPTPPRPDEPPLVTLPPPSFSDVLDAPPTPPTPSAGVQRRPARLRKAGKA